jgi:hypothetical protein
MTLATRPVKRETAVAVRGRALIAELHPGYLLLREKGRRTPVSVDLRAVYDLGWKIMARAQAAERKQRRSR